MADIKKLLESIDRIAQEGTMSSAAKHKSGPKFGGYWKGTDTNPPKPGMGVGGCSESADTENEIQHWKDMVLHWGRQGNEEARLRSLSRLKTAQAKMKQGSDDGMKESDEHFTYEEDKAYLGEPHIRESDAPLDPPGYALRVAELEAEGMTRSDAQGIADMEYQLKIGPWKKDKEIVDAVGKQDENYLGRMEGGASGIVEDELEEDSWSDGVGQWSSGSNAWGGDGKNAWSGSAVSEDDESDQNLEALYDCEYVQDLVNGNEVFRMSGDPYDRRVQIVDKNGRGWNISPSRLTPVYDERLIAKWFPGEGGGDEGGCEHCGDPECHGECFRESIVADEMIGEAHYGNEISARIKKPKLGDIVLVIVDNYGGNPKIYRKDEEGKPFISVDDAYEEGNMASAYHHAVYQFNGKKWVKKESATEPSVRGGGQPYFSFFEDDDEMIGEAKPANTLSMIKQLDIGVDQVNKDREGNFIFRQGYYYRHGYDSTKLADKVKRRLEDAGFKVEIIDHGDHWAAFRGGASIKASSHWWVKARILDTLPDVAEPIEEADMPDLERNRAIAGAKVDDKSDPEKLAIWWSHYRRAIGNKQADRQAKDYADRMTALEPKYRPNPFVAKESMDAGDFLNPDWGLCKAEDGGWYVRKLYRRPKCVAGPFDTMLDANINRLSQDFKDDYDVAQYSSAAHDFVKPVKDESVEDITEELKKAFEDYVSNEKYNDDTLYPPKSKKASVDKKKVKKPKVVDANVLDEGISSKEVGDAIAYRISRQKPELITKYGVEVLADAIDDVASFHAGAEELGTSDISIMVNQVVKNLERDYVKEAKHFRTAYGWAGGRNEKTGKKYKHPEQIKKDREDKKNAQKEKPSVAEAKRPSANRELWDKVNRKGVQAPIDRERYTDLSYQGLEGPFRAKTGEILYYDPKEGKYYSRDKDMYVDYGLNEDVEGYHAHHRWENVPQRQRDELARRAQEEKWKRELDREKQEKENPFMKDVDEAKFASRARSILQKKLDDLERMNKPVAPAKPPEQKPSEKKPLDEEEAMMPHAVQLFQLMQPETRKDMVKYLDSLRKNYGPEKSLQTYRMAQKMRQANKDMPKNKAVEEDSPVIDPNTGQPMVPQPAPKTATPITTPATTAQQPPAPKGTPTAVPAPGQPMLPKAGQAGGAPVSPPPGTPKPPSGSGVNTSTTPIQGLATSLGQLAQPGAQMAAKKAADALARVK